MKNIYNLLTIALLLSVFASCDDGFEPIFEKPAKERVKEVLDSCNNVLLSGEYGWEMQYYFTPEDGGYNLILEFTGANDVSIASKNYFTNNMLLESSGTYETNNSNGPLLAFNTYNDALHMFSDPDYLDLGGDFEFVILSVSENQIKLKGKKSNLQIVMNRISSNIDAQQYFEKIEDVKKMLFESTSAELIMEIEGESSSYVFSGGYSSVFSVQNDTIKESLPFIITQTGLRLYAPEQLSGYDAQTFVFNEDMTALISTEAPEVSLTRTSNQMDYFLNSTKEWYFNADSMSEDFSAPYSKIEASVDVKYPGNTDFYMAVVANKLGYFTLRLGFIYNGNKVKADLYFDKDLQENSLMALNYTGNGNSAGMVLVDKIDGFAGMTQLLQSSFKVVSNNIISLQSFRLIKVSDEETWLDVYNNQ